MPRFARLLSLSPRAIAGSYLVFGVLWILLSDRVVTAVAETPFLLTSLQTVKGWAFVLLSAALIYGLTRTRENQLETSRRRLVTASQELQVLHRIFRHNIRNDLNVIRGYANTVRDGLNDDDERAQLRTVSRTADQIIDMSEKLRIIERADLRARTNGSVDLVAIVERECDRVRAAHPAVAVETDLPETCPIYGDRSLTYVVRELLDNAIEHHTDPPAQRRVTVTVEERSSTVSVQVADDGPGIPEAELAVLHAGEETQLVHVSGVGLWLVTWLCRLYRGTARFESTPGEGTVVTLEFRPVTAVDSLTGRASGELTPPAAA